MNIRNEIGFKPAPYYDVGGWFVVVWLAGFSAVAIFGSLLDYIWNYLVLSVALRLQHVSITKKRKLVYTAIITALGLLIDWLYYEFTWGTLVMGDFRVRAAFERPGTHPGLELATIIIPAVLIGLVNFCTALIYLHLSMKKALVVGGLMAVFTAPWLIMVFIGPGW